MATVEIPAQLRSHVGGKARVKVEANTVGEALDQLFASAPSLRAVLFVESTGRLKRTVGVFLGEDDVRSDEGLARAVRTGDVIVLISAMAGG